MVTIPTEVDTPLNVDHTSITIGVETVLIEFPVSVVVTVSVLVVTPSVVVDEVDVEELVVTSV